jgi:hypothetical protein
MKPPPPPPPRPEPSEQDLELAFQAHRREVRARMGAPLAANSGCGGFLAALFLSAGVFLLLGGSPLSIVAFLLGALFFVAGTIQRTSAQALIAAADAEARRSWDEKRRR